MTTPLTFDAMRSILSQRMAPLPDHRTGSNTQYSLQEAALGAFGIFFMQSPSFLEYPRHLQQATGHNNACTLFGVEQIPCDHQGRTRLDPIRPRALDRVFLEVFECLGQHGALANCRGCKDPLLIALDGTQYFSSNPIHCHYCLRRQTSKGHPRYYHPALPPVFVCPGRSEVLAMPPEDILPQDGHDKQDGERGAGNRWMVQHARSLASHGLTLLGDDLSSTHPLWKLVLQHGRNVIFVSQPASHATRYERLAFWQASDGIKERDSRHWHGRCIAVPRLRSINEVVLRSGRGALAVNWLEMTVVKSQTGEQLYHHSFITHHPLTAESVTQVAHAGRGRWKSENDNNNVLKTKGYHIEHNFGHGKQSLSAVLRSLTLLAFLSHTVLGWWDDTYALLRQTLVRRQTCFEDMRVLSRYIVFESGHHLMDFMITGLELKPEFDTG